MFTDLPPEILQQIIEHNLADDLQSLKSCSLVCWQWRHVTLPVLMSKVVMTYAWTGRPQEGYQVTAEGVRKSVPFFSRYLRHVVVSTPSHLLRGEHEAQEANDLFYAVLAVLPDFARLSRFTLTGAGMFKILASDTQVKLPNVYHFTVYRPGRMLPIKTISVFTHLRILHLIGISLDLNEAATEWNRDPSDTNAPIPVLEELALQLSPGPFDTFVKWACRTKTLNFSKLKTLKISMADGEAEKQCFLTQLVPLVGRKLQTLDTDLYNLVRGPTMLSNDIKPGSELSQNFPSLTTLRINLRAHFHGDRLKMAHRQWVPRCISEFIPNKPLRVVEVLPWNLDIFVKAEDLDDPRGTSELNHLWAEADRTLAGCRELKRFSVYSPRDEINIHRNPWDPEQLHLLLPVSSTKGILHSERNTDLWPGFDVDETRRP